MTPKERAAMQQALEALHAELEAGTCEEFENAAEKCYEAITSLREALAEQAEQERKYGELAGTHNWTPPNYTDEQWQKLDQEYQDHVAEQALQKLSDFHQSIERNGHWSDCSTHNEPAYPNGECDCGGYPAEQEPECKYKEAYIIWQDKTEWVQETAHPKELGMHRADVLRQRIENLQNAATHPVRTKDLTDELQQKCSDWGTYWRASDAHGVNLSIEQATELLRDALGVEVEIAHPEQVKQEPVGRWNWNEAKFEWLTKFDYYKHHMTPLYAAPVRTKDQK